jgi:hypothetical protein
MCLTPGSDASRGMFLTRRGGEMANARMYHERYITYALEADEDGVIDQKICTVVVGDAGSSGGLH